MATRYFGITHGGCACDDGTTHGIGSGWCAHLPIGFEPGRTYRSYIRFANDWSGMRYVTNVTLYMKSSDENHILFGGTAGKRTFRIRQVQTSWDPGSWNTPLSYYNASWGGLVWDQKPTATNTDQVTAVGSASQNTWQSFDITAIARHWAPSTVWFTNQGAAGAGEANWGVELLGDGSDDQYEFWSDNAGGSEPYIVVTYATNSDPYMALYTPVNGAVETGGSTFASPSITVTGGMYDADGDAIQYVDLTISTNYDLSSPIVSGWSATGISGYSYSRTITTLSRGVGYYISARCWDGYSASAWTTTTWFMINNATAPTITGTAGTVMEMTVETTDSGPRAILRWTYSDPEGQPQASYVARLQDSTGVTTYETQTVSSAATYVKFAYASLAHGTTYKFSITTTDSMGLSTGAVTQNRVAKWATRIEYYDVNTPSTIGVSVDTNQTAYSRAVIQYGSSSGSGVAPTNYNVDRSAVAIADHFWVKYWLFAWNGEATSAVQINNLVITYVAASTVPDGWSLGTGSSLSTSRAWYGTRSLRIDGTGSGSTQRWTSRTISGMKIGEVYTLSGRILSFGNTGAALFFYNGVSGLGTTTGLTATTPEFTHVSATFTARSESDGLFCWITGAAGTYALFDALKLEEGPVATPWTASILNRAMAVDGSGLMVDGLAQGTFRLRGATGGTRDEVNLSNHGLRFGGASTSVEVSSPYASMLFSEGYIYEGVNSTPFDSSYPARVLISADGDNEWSLIIRQGSANSTGPYQMFAKSRGTETTPTIVSNGDSLGNLYFGGHDGVEYVTGAAIAAVVNGTPGVGDMPTDMLFYTAEDGNQAHLVRMRITSDGLIGVGIAAPSGLIHLYNTHSSRITDVVQAQHASYTGWLQYLAADRAGSSSFYFIVATTSTGGDYEFLVRGDGAVSSDQAATTPADYAEYFETVDGLSIPSGVSVVLQGDKVRPATQGDAGAAVIGVVRPEGASAIVANSHWARHKDKYLKDDYGMPVMEDYKVWSWTETVVEEGLRGQGAVEKEHSYAFDEVPEGVKVPKKKKVTTQQRRKLSPSFDKTRTYIPRSEREEWVIVGMLGQVPVTVGQPLGDRWIKMKNVSPTVDMYLVR